MPRPTAVKVSLGSLRTIRHGPLRLSPLPVFGKLAASSLLRVRLPPNAAHPAIFHARTDELSVLLGGGGTGVVGGRHLKLAPGDVLAIPAGTRHEFRAGGRGMDVLTLFSPPLDLKRPDVVRAEAARGGAATPRRRR